MTAAAARRYLHQRALARSLSVLLARSLSVWLALPSPFILPFVPFSFSLCFRLFFCSRSIDDDDRSFFSLSLSLSLAVTSVRSLGRFLFAWHAPTNAEISLREPSRATFERCVRILTCMVRYGNGKCSEMNYFLLFYSNILYCYYYSIH